MPKKSEAGKRTTIYRLTGVKELKDAVRRKYLDRDSFALNDLSVGDRPAVLAIGAMLRDEAAWCTNIRELTGESHSVAGSTPAAVLVLRPDTSTAEDSGVAYALSYGMGFQLLEPARIDSIFGQRIAVRTADPADLRSLTATTMDERSRTSRATIPMGDGLRGFGLGDVGEAVSRVVAMANVPRLSRATGKPTQIRGSDALNIPIGITSAEVIADIALLEGILQQEPPEQLKILEQLTAVKNPEVRASLDQLLEAALNSDGDSRIGLAWPHERIDDNGTPDSWKTSGLPYGHNKTRAGQPDWDVIWGALNECAVDTRVSRLSSATLQLFRDADGEDPISQAIPLRRWIAFEADMAGATYALYDGAWYQMHHDYAENIRTRTAEIFATDPGLNLPPWPDDQDENTYNKQIASELGGVCLDRVPLKTSLHGRGIEACDVYLNDGTLIHVKRTDRSAPASHLIAQALVSADALCNDGTARDSLRTVISESGGDPAGIANRPKRIVLVMGRKGDKTITVDELFTFTQVNLVRHVTGLGARGVPVHIATI